MMRTFPSRQRWKRLALGAVILIAVALIVNGLLAWRAELRLQNRLEAIRTAGDPASIAELAPEPIPADRNAAAIIRQATPRINAFASEEGRFSNTPLGLAMDDLQDRGEPATEEQMEAIRAIVDNYPDLEEAFAKAAACDEYASLLDFSLDQTQFIEAMLEIQGPIRQAARYLVWKMEVDLADGQPEQAVRRGIQILKLADLYDNEPTMVSFLVSTAIRGIAVANLYDALAAGPISAELHAELDNELAQLDSPQRLVHALKTERAIGAGWFDSAFAQVGPSLAALLGWPMKGFQVGVFDQMDEHIRLAEQPWHEVRGGFPLPGQPPTESGHGVLADLLVPAVQAAFQAHARSLATFRALRVFNAMCAYEEQNGQRPTGLADLTLSMAATTDPFTGESLLVKDTAEGWAIYSVMHNSVDDDGDFRELKDYGVAPPKLRLTE